MPKAKKVVQLDYYTGAFIKEYDSISDAERDNGLKVTNLCTAFNRFDCCMAYIHQHELLFMWKKHYDNLIKAAKDGN